MKTHEPQKLVRLSGLAQQLRLPLRWLREEADAGRIPHLRAGNVLLFDPDAVLRALAVRANHIPNESEALR